MSEKINDFADFNKNNIIKVVVSDNEFLGFVSWNFSHTLNFFNTEFENTDVRSIGDFKNDNVDLEYGLREMDKWIAEKTRYYDQLNELRKKLEKILEREKKEMV